MAFRSFVTLIVSFFMFYGGSVYASVQLRVHDDPHVNSPKKVVFLGNSLTYVSSDPSIGWHHNHGMAASSANKDYVHQLLKKLEINYNDSLVLNLYPLEVDSSFLSNKLKVIKQAIDEDTVYAFIQMGDNVGHEKSSVEYRRSLSGILEYLSQQPKLRVFCMSSYWSVSVADDVTEELCVSQNYSVVYIGDLFRFQDPSYQYFDNQAINWHPKDIEMQAIADRLYEFISNSWVNKLPFYFQRIYFNLISFFKWILG